MFEYRTQTQIIHPIWMLVQQAEPQVRDNLADLVSLTEDSWVSRSP